MRAPSPIATFGTLDEAESALDWIGVRIQETVGGFLGELTDDERELVETAAHDPDAPPPVRDLARALIAAWEASATGTLAFAVAYEEADQV